MMMMSPLIFVNNKNGRMKCWWDKIRSDEVLYCDVIGIIHDIIFFGESKIE